MDLNVGLTPCNQTDPDFIPKYAPDCITQASFYALSPISGYLSLLLIIGYVKFKHLRERPGDLILGMAISNLILSIHWTLSLSISPLVLQQWGCYISGVIAVFAGFMNYIYNIAFVYYLRQKLQNLLKQARISSSLMIHIGCLLSTLVFTLYLVGEGEIGQNLFDTCSKKFFCDPNYITGTLVVIFYLSYELYAVYLYIYIKSSFGQAISSSNEAELFVANYRGYLIISTLLYLGIAVGITYSEFANGYDHVFMDIIVPLNNACKVLQGIVITIYRYRDPLVRRSMARLIFFWRKDRFESSLNNKRIPVDENENQLDGIFIDDDDRQKDLNASLVSSDYFSETHGSFEQTNIYDRFSKKRRHELTYSVLISVIVSYLDPSHLSDRMLSMQEKIKQIVTYEINEEVAFEVIPNAKEELKKAKCHIIPVKMNTVAPGIFSELLRRDFGPDSVAKTFDLAKNRRKIRKETTGHGGGKSGEFFFFFEDQKLIIKSISNDEMTTLLKILGNYYEHLRLNPESLITRIFGIFKLEWQYQPLNLIVMRNVCPFPNEYIERRFDIKGSTFSREVLKDNIFYDEEFMKANTLKDSDFLKLEKTIRVNEAAKRKILQLVKKDARFLWSAGLMDYSLMIFIVNKGKYLSDVHQQKVRRRDSQRYEDIKWVFSVPMEDNPDLCYNIGIIDLLQKYTVQKMMEKNVKKIINFDLGLDTSAQDCTVYRERFGKFVSQILELPEDESDTLST